jgi:hypothetical protein
MRDKAGLLPLPLHSALVIYHTQRLLLDSLGYHRIQPVLSVDPLELLDGEQDSILPRRECCQCFRICKQLGFRISFQ